MRRPSDGGAADAPIAGRAPAPEFVDVGPTDRIVPATEVTGTVLVRLCDLLGVDWKSVAAMRLDAPGLLTVRGYERDPAGRFFIRPGEDEPAAWVLVATVRWPIE